MGYDDYGKFMALMRKFLQGMVRGISQGISQGELQGKEKKQRQVIFNMYRDNFTLQQIARVVDLSIDAVKQILNSDNKMKI